MNFEKVVFGFFVLLAATLNFGYVTGDMTDPLHHNALELYAAVVVSLVATVLKLGDRTQMGAIHLATSLVADIQLIIATIVWVYGTQGGAIVPSPYLMSSTVSLALGAVVANAVSVILMVIETANFRHRD